MPLSFAGDDGWYISKQENKSDFTIVVVVLKTRNKKPSTRSRQ